MVQCVSHLARNGSIVSLNPVTVSHCFLKKETLPLLLSTGWSKELDPA